MARRKTPAPSAQASTTPPPVVCKDSELSPTERESLEVLRVNRSKTHPPRLKYVKQDSGQITLEPDPDQRGERMLLGFFSATGTSDFGLSNYFFAQVAGLVNGTLLVGSAGRSNPEKLTERANAALALLHGIKPRNEIEAMLAVQMLATQAMAMEMLQRAGEGGEAWMMDQTLNHANKLMRTFTAQVEALQRLRGNVSQQKVVVEHVHVEAGGQAVVGAVAGGEGGKEK